MARKQKDSKKVYQVISSMRNQLYAETENAYKCPVLTGRSARQVLKKICKGYKKWGQRCYIFSYFVTGPKGLRRAWRQRQKKVLAEIGNFLKISALGGAARDAEEGRVADSAPHLGISQISYSPFPATYSIGLNHIISRTAHTEI